MQRSTTLFLSTLVVLAGSGAGAPAVQAADPVPPLVFTSDRDGDREIYLRASDGTLRQLTRNRADDSSAVWSPDGRQLAFVSDRDGDSEIFVMDADGSRLRQLTRNSRTADGVPVRDAVPAWSPDGEQIAFASERDGGEAEIYRMDADGTDQVRLTRTPRYVTDQTPSWSPDGRSIVFNSDRAGFDNVEIYRMRPDGTQVVRLTRTAAGVDDNAPEYSPDGRRIVFSSTRSGNQHDLYTMAADGRDVRRVGGAPDLDDVFPRWTPDGERLLFHTFAGPEGTPSEDVWSTRADGGDRRRITTGPAHDSSPDARPGRR